MIEFPRLFEPQLQAPILLVAGNRSEALRLIPVLQQLRAAAAGSGALLVNASPDAHSVNECLRQCGLRADLCPGAGSTASGLSAFWQLWRLIGSIGPSLVVTGGSSVAAGRALWAARLRGLATVALMGAEQDVLAPRARRRMRAATWRYLAAEHPGAARDRPRTLRVGDPLFDLCREQAAAVAAPAHEPGRRVLMYLPQAPWARVQRLCGELSTAVRDLSDCRIDWLGDEAEPAASGEVEGSGSRIRLLGRLPHWRVLGLLRRADVVVTDSPVLAMEARWAGRPVLWASDQPPPRGCIRCEGPQALAASLRHALLGHLAATPLQEDGRAAARLSAHLLSLTADRSLAGLLSRRHLRWR